jgi:hypothetical protein
MCIVDVESKSLLQVAAGSDADHPKLFTLLHGMHDLDNSVLKLIEKHICWVFCLHDLDNSSAEINCQGYLLGVL